MGGLLAAFSTMATACWGGDGTGESDDSDAAYESYARALCIAQRQLGETLLPQVTPGAGPPVEAMITVWEEFIEALEDAEPPLSLQAFHAEWLEMQRDDLATLRVTGHTNYWNRPRPRALGRATRAAGGSRSPRAGVRLPDRDSASDSNACYFRVALTARNSHDGCGTDRLRRSDEIHRARLAVDLEQRKRRRGAGGAWRAHAEP